MLIRSIYVSDTTQALFWGSCICCDLTLTLQVFVVVHEPESLPATSYHQELSYFSLVGEKKHKRHTELKEEKFI